MKVFMKQIGDVDKTLSSGEDCKYKCDRRLRENACQSKVINVCPEHTELVIAERWIFV